MLLATSSALPAQLSGRSAVRTAGDQTTAAETTTIYLLRHAEKRADQGDDPDLTRPGRTRARVLARILGSQEIDRIYSSEYRRTHFTVLPLAVKVGLPIYTVDAGDGESLVRRLLNDHLGETVVVCGHSNTIPALIKGLGVREAVEIPEGRYGDLFVVRILAGKAELERRRF